MLHIVETGTDAASLCFFDPAALAEDFDEGMEADPTATLEIHAKEERLWWKSTDGDGSYLFHFYVDSEAPDRIRRYACDAEEMPNFAAPSGTIWTCGAEYAAKEPMRGNATTPKGGLAKHCHMGSRFELPPGKYFATVWRIEWPVGIIETELELRLGKGAVRRQEILGQLSGLGLVVLVLMTGGCIAFTFVAKTQTALIFWGILFVLWILCIGFLRLVSRLERHSGKQSIEREFPSIVAHLRRLS